MSYVAAIEWAFPLHGLPRVPLLGKAEKSQLEELILAKLSEHYELNGSGALLEDGVRVVVDSRGATIDRGEARDPLAAVPLRSLFTALCYLTAGSPELPRESLAELAAEATQAAAVQINRFGAD
jgi:hypothetical protein